MAEKSPGSHHSHPSVVGAELDRLSTTCISVTGTTPPLHSVRRSRRVTPRTSHRAKQRPAFVIPWSAVRRVTFHFRRSHLRTSWRTSPTHRNDAATNPRPPRPTTAALHSALGRTPASDLRRLRWHYRQSLHRQFQRPDKTDTPPPGCRSRYIAASPPHLPVASCNHTHRCVQTPARLSTKRSRRSRPRSATLPA